ncbi:MAG: prepilin-type N-terminal cleavage/methylation domain-containing protein, partial [Candidatus Sumerlaeota bacterium]
MKSKAFTLIELLIVVAIIAILAAIALPNFLEAQARSKVSRARSDLRTLSLGLQGFFIDHQKFPNAEINGTLKYLNKITTPIAYIAHAHLSDPFTPDEYQSPDVIPTYRYFGFNKFGVMNTYASTGELYSPRSTQNEKIRINWYMLYSHGPNGRCDNLEVNGVSGTFVQQDMTQNLDNFIHHVYDATNGSISTGGIFYSGGYFDG